MQISAILSVRTGTYLHAERSDCEQITYNACKRDEDIDFELFVSEVEKQPAMESKGHINLNKQTQTKALLCQ